MQYCVQARPNICGINKFRKAEAAICFMGRFQ